MMNKKGYFKLGNLDAIAAVLVLAGIFSFSQNAIVGLILIGLGIIKQLSGR